MTITQRAYDKIGDLLQVEEERIKEREQSEEALKKAHDNLSFFIRLSI